MRSLRASGKAEACGFSERGRIKGHGAPETTSILLLVVVVAFSAIRLFGFQFGDVWGDVADTGGGSGIPGVPDETTTTTTTTSTTAP
jgi:hypothetical protein